MFHIQHFERYLEEGRERLTYLAKIRANGQTSGSGFNIKATGNRIRKANSSFAAPPFRIISYGSTSNNRREFRFLEEKLRECGVRCQFSNIADQPKIPLSEQHYRYRNGFLNILWDKIEEHVDDLKTKTLSDLHADYCMTFYPSFFGFTASLLSGSIRRNMPFALVSNDHAPMPVAFAQVCRAFGIPVGYIQHAEINPDFPPLAFDFAVLNNSASLEIYSAISSQLPPTFILPRFGYEPDRKRLKRDLNKPVKVGVFLTSLCDFNRVGDLIEGLKNNERIESVCIQPHPRISEQQLRRIQKIGVPVGRLDLNKVDVAVCQNTSIVIELIHRGIKTLQIFEYDFVKNDHYGFIENRIVPRLQKHELIEPFWVRCTFTREWESKYSKFSPDWVGLDESEKLSGFLSDYLEKVRFVPSVGGMLAGSRRGYATNRLKATPLALRREVLSYLGLNPDVSLDEVFNHIGDLPYKARGDLNEVALKKKIHKVVVALYGRREPAIVAWMNRGGKILSATSIGAWAALYSRFWTSSTLTNKEFEFFLAIREELATSPFASECESLLCCLVVRRNDIKLTNMYLRAYRSIASLRLDLRARTELGKHLFANKEVFSDAARLHSRLASDLTDLNRLRVEIIGCARVNVEKSISHEQVEQELYRAARPELKGEIDEILMPFFFKFRDRLKFMELFWKECQRRTFLSIVENALVNAEPFSYVRLSDGEGWLFSDDSEIFTRADELNRERHWWGCELQVQEKKHIREKAAAAVTSADILGVPSIYRILQSVDSRSTTLKGNVTFRGLLQVMLMLLEKNSLNATAFSDEKGNVPLFGDLDNLERLITLADNSVVISSVRPKKLKECLGENQKLYQIVIPTHFRTSMNPSYQSGDMILPELYKDIDSELAERCAPGTLVLNASGVAGKGFLATARNRGAVALDIGGVVDYWIQKNG